jgi:F0F1-type ATP synthase assembly protein I
MIWPDADKAIRNPWRYVLRAALTVQVFALVSTVCIALVLTVIAAPSVGIAFVVGGLIAGLPQVWFVVRGSANRAPAHAITLALGKLVLSGTGFALWFGLFPNASPGVTLSGTATYIAVAACGMVVASRRT